MRPAAGHDADCPRVVQAARAQPDRLRHADHLHPPPHQERALRQPDLRGVRHHREDHQPDHPEHTQHAREGLRSDQGASGPGHSQGQQQQVTQPGGIG